MEVLTLENLRVEDGGQQNDLLYLHHFLLEMHDDTPGNITTIDRFSLRVT